MRAEIGKEIAAGLVKGRSGLMRIGTLEPGESVRFAGALSYRDCQAAARALNKSLKGRRFKAYRRGAATEIERVR